MLWRDFGIPLYFFEVWWRFQPDSSRSRSEDGCSVAHLSKLSTSASAFRCEDICPKMGSDTIFVCNILVVQKIMFQFLLKSGFRQNITRKHRQDGSLDVEHEGTVNLLRHGWTYDAVEVYRMAPVYLREASWTATPGTWSKKPTLIQL